MENATEPCLRAIPGALEYFEALSSHQTYMITTCCFLAAVSVVLYLNQVSWMSQHSSKTHISAHSVICSVHPIACLMGAASVVIPRSYFFCETISHFAFLTGALSLFSLFSKYVEGESNLIRNKYTGKTGEFTVSTPPCCCCCAICLHPGPLSKSKISFVRWLIIQLAVIHAVLFVTLNIIYINDASVFDLAFPYFVPVIVLSILLGIWGLNMMVRMFINAVPESYRVKQKYFNIQLVLIFCKAQPAITKAITEALSDGCSETLIPASVSLNVYIQLAVCIQMTLLTIWASRLYRVPSRL